MAFLKQFFGWWSGQTLNTRFHTWRFGEFVGHDDRGNAYYQARTVDPALGWKRRWVIYKGESEASEPPPGWFGWLRNLTDEPPTKSQYKPREWELPHQPNRTGTPDAWRPPGSTLSSGKRPQTGGDYEAWTPGA